MTAALFASVCLIAACGLIYELIAGTLASYLLGDSVLQFSTVIGSYLFAMGIGSWLSRYIRRGLVARFIAVELMVGLVGGFSSAILFLAFGWSPGWFRPLLYGLVLLIGTLVGLEIPLLMRILKERLKFEDLVSNVLTFDYLGALAASLLFPLVLAPKLGLVRSAMAFGMLNAGVALWSTFLLAAHLPNPLAARLQCAAVLAALAGGMFAADAITTMSEQAVFADDIVLARTTPYQRIVVTRWRDDFRLFLNAHLQFSSRDEYRYHEALVHPALASLSHRRRVLVLGGGDGMAVREILRYPDVEEVVLVDLDREMTAMFRDHPELSRLNGGAFRSPRVKVVNADAFVWLRETDARFQLAIVDFPDPTNFSVGKLYTTSFYRELARHLEEGGLAAVQSTSPMFARRSFWCIAETMRAAGWRVSPYHVYVPSFGEWGFMLGSLGDYRTPERLPEGLRFLTVRTLPPLFDFPGDMARVDAEVNRLNDQVLVRYHEQEWSQVSR